MCSAEILMPFGHNPPTNVYSPAFSDPPSPMSVSSDHEEPEATVLDPVPPPVQRFVNRRPLFPTIYHEALQPLSPLTTLPVPSSVMPFKSLAQVDEKRQEEFLNLVRGSDLASLEAFLSQHSGQIDVNSYNEHGDTPLHEACVQGHLALVQILVRFGAEPKLTNRDGFSLIHLASFSYNSELLSYILNLKKAPQ